MSPYADPYDMQDFPAADLSSSAGPYYAAWERFAHTGNISDYLYYKTLENNGLEAIAHYGGTDKDQWNHSPDPHHGG